MAVEFEAAQPVQLSVVAKRALDIAIALAALPVGVAACLPFAVAIWLGDRQIPIYAGERVGKNWRPYRQLKLRTMMWGAERSGVDATPADDPRITPVGRWLRRWKIDELPQLINVLVGDMSLVGPRPNLLRECTMYSDVEKHILDVTPGVTDMSSIVFSDEERILAGARDPDLAYHQLVRPWKSRLCLLYIEKRSLRLDLELIGITALLPFSRPWALRLLQGVLKRLGADPELLRIARREAPLTPHPPPGLAAVVEGIPTKVGAAAA